MPCFVAQLWPPTQILGVLRGQDLLLISKKFPLLAPLGSARVRKDGQGYGFVQFGSRFLRSQIMQIARNFALDNFPICP